MSVFGLLYRFMTDFCSNDFLYATCNRKFLTKTDNYLLSTLISPKLAPLSASKEYRKIIHSQILIDSATLQGSHSYIIHHSLHHPTVTTPYISQHRRRCAAYRPLKSKSNEVKFISKSRCDRKCNRFFINQSYTNK